VVDQSSAPVPGVTVQLVVGGRVTQEAVTAADGTFALGACGPESRVAAALSGFDKVTVTCAEASRIVLSLGRVSETVDVVAPANVVADSPTSLAVGAELPRLTMQRLPAASPHMREALPLLPSVIRGVDGLLHIDGVRPHESPLLIDGFNVTDPATGVSSIDLPLESVRAAEVLRDPMTITFGGALGSLASIDTRSGGESLEAGVQGFVPRPRLTGGGFGRLEGFSPRGFASGSAGSAVRYLASAEYDFDRIPVPGVTASSGSPDTRQVGGSVFARVDVRLSAADSLTAEAIFFPRTQRLHGLSPLRTVEAAPTLRDRDLFGGLVGRHVFAPGSILTLRVGLLSHRTELRPEADGAPEITPAQAAGGFFSTLDRRASRLEGGVSWQRQLGTGSDRHDLTLAATAEGRTLRGSVAERRVDVRDAAGTLVRVVGFGPPSVFGADDGGLGVALRDLWRRGERLQLDMGARGDWSDLGGFSPSGRVGFRYSLGDDATVVKGGLGTFVGSVPLTAAAFGGFPMRFEGEPGGGEAPLVGLKPVVGRLTLPRALASNVHVERRIGRGWEAMLGLGLRRSSRLATLSVRESEGSLVVESAGRSTYRGVEAALRHTWGARDQVFVSYTRSSARGELNDFSTLFASGDTEILQTGGVARLGSDAPHRLLAWATISLPAGFGLAPAVEWRSGFPYSAIDAQRELVGPPNSASFPPFFSLDLVVDKTITVKGKRVKLNVQVFNATNHSNPRDVFAVVGAPRFGTFVNSVGPTVRGDIGVDW
jgi:hypothetical protein